MRITHFLRKAELRRVFLLVAFSMDQPDPWEQAILSLFHHIHHTEDGEHEVHHCGGAHVKVDPEVNYTIKHCPCGKHSINKPKALGHATADDLDLAKVTIQFPERCPNGGWHLESGKIVKVSHGVD